MKSGNSKVEPKVTSRSSVHDVQHKKHLVSSLLPVVGIGASAGGLQALEAFCSNLPLHNGFAFIVVSHQQPRHISLLPDLLAGFTKIPVIAAEDGMPLKKDHIFVCPPGKNLAVFHRRIYLMDRTDHETMRMPINFFFHSLAEDVKEMSVGIILSGTGTDGTLGLKAIKSASGMAMVQDPATAKFDGMPKSAIARGDVDFVLPVEKMGQQLLQYFDAPCFNNFQTLEPAEMLAATEPLQKIFILLRNRTGHDLSAYKPTTVNRRISRRMNIHHIQTMNAYVQFLQENPVEIDKLFKELLINVTNFFRDEPAFAALKNIALPKLFENKPDNYEMRVWVPGCSTGEEAYSLAILFKEYNETHGKTYSFQIFATDLDESSIIQAREGLYPSGIETDVLPDRLTRYFEREDSQYRIAKEIRDTVIFATQNLLQDPPFTRIDLISCRNLLIYLDGELQKKIFPHFHYTLKPGGLLFLGTSESIGNFDHLFSVVDKKSKIYQRKDIQAGLPTSKPRLLPTSAKNAPSMEHKSHKLDSQPGQIARQIEKLLLERYAPVCIIIDEHGRIIYIHGHTGNYLEPAQGQPNWNIIEMAREGLRVPLATSLRKVQKKGDMEIINSGIRVKTNNGFETIDLKLVRLLEPEALQDLFLVSFHPHHKDAGSQTGEPAVFPILINKNDKEQLAHELLSTKKSLRATIEELETSNEELKSTNEELQSANEELQSSNEELETSKEEMQSLNEELNTINSELQTKVDALSKINDDMQNLLNSTNIATIFLDNNLKIRRFTKSAINIVHLINSDIGRPLGDLASSLKYAHLIDDAKAVLQTLIYKDAEVQSTNGAWYLLRILPYRTAENMIDGLVITFIDIDRLKKAEQAALDASMASAIVNTVSNPLLVLDENLSIITANPAFHKAFNPSHEDLTGQSFFTINRSAWDSDQLRGHLYETLNSNTPFDAFNYTCECPVIGKKHLTLNGRLLQQSSTNARRILLAIEDVERDNP
ncbi:CheR family methyltransferase [Methylobacter sp. BlB1]|uniref:CheR family methyltransferase n=1 Tax=Methylobacter sp. BlB1 TaxID=2785914 RepID=UPI00351B7066